MASVGLDGRDGVFSQKSAEFFDNDSKGLATLESGHRIIIVIIAAAIIAL